MASGTRFSDVVVRWVEARADWNDDWRMWETEIETDEDDSTKLDVRRHPFHG